MATVSAGQPRHAIRYSSNPINEAQLLTEFYMYNVWMQETCELLYSRERNVENVSVSHSP